MLVLAFLLAVGEGSKHFLYFYTKTDFLKMFQFGAKIRGEEMIGFPIKFPIWWFDWLRDWTIKSGDVKGWADWAGQPWSWFPSGDDLGVWSEPARFREFIARSPFFGHESQVSCHVRSFRAHNFFKSSFVLFFHGQKECDWNCKGIFALATLLYHIQRSVKWVKQHGGTKRNEEKIEEGTPTQFLALICLH